FFRLNQKFNLMEQYQNLLTDDLKIDGSIKNHLKEAGGWAKFLGILGFIISGLLVLVALLLPSFMDKMSLSRYNSYSNYGSSLDSAFRAGMTIGYLLAAAVMFLVAMF